MILTPTLTRNVAGLMYYERKCTTKDIVLARGLDELTECENSDESQVVMTFTRRFHHKKGQQAQENELPFKLNCRFKNASVIHVAVEIPTIASGVLDRWEGVLKKC